MPLGAIARPAIHTPIKSYGPYIVMAYVVMASRGDRPSCSTSPWHGLCSYGLCSHGLRSYGLRSYGLYGHAIVVPAACNSGVGCL